MMTLNQRSREAEMVSGEAVAERRSWRAGLPMRGKRPISKPSNIQPRKAAMRAMLRPMLEGEADLALGAEGMRK